MGQYAAPAARPGVGGRRTWLVPASLVALGTAPVVAGLGVALSALWLNQFFPNPDAARVVIYPLRLAFGVAMVTTIVLGFRAVRRRDFARHRAWMIRSYAIGLVRTKPRGRLVATPARQAVA